MSDDDKKPIPTITLSGIFSTEKVTDNVGATPPLARARGEKGGRPGEGESRSQAVEAEAETAQQSADARDEKPKHKVPGVPRFLCQHFARELTRIDERAKRNAEKNSKAIGIVRSQIAKQITEQFDTREISATTAKKYRKAYEIMLSEQKLPIDKATTKNAFDFYRSAFRYCLIEDIETLRKASEKARKAKDIEKAKQRTTRMFALAVCLEASKKTTWTSKDLKTSVKSKSKNPAKGGPKVANRQIALLPLLSRQNRTLERHAERLAIIEAAGFRPAELVRGVQLTTDRDKHGKPCLSLSVNGSKVSKTRGQTQRKITLTPVTPSEKELYARTHEAGGRRIFKTTEADIRSLNRALNKACPGLSCYSYRHAFASSLKKACAEGKLTRTEAAAAMGHRSTASLSTYGNRSGGSQRALRAKSTERVKSSPQINTEAVRAGRATRINKTRETRITLEKRQFEAVSRPNSPRGYRFKT